MYVHCIVLYMYMYVHVCPLFGSVYVCPLYNNSTVHSLTTAAFDDDDSRTYILSACTCDEMKGWMEAIKMARQDACTSGDCLASRPKGCSRPRELWFSIRTMYICVVLIYCASSYGYTPHLWQSFSLSIHSLSPCLSPCLPLLHLSSSS